MELTEKILSIVRLKGPVIPSQVNKEIGTDILIASAALGELVSRNELKVSSIKLGGTPLYYIAGQEIKLQNYANRLHEKEKQAYDLLQQKKILRDTEMEPVVRVALRAIRDFAKPLNVNMQGNTELFWKWYLTSNKEAEEILQKIVVPEVKKEEVKKEPEEKVIEKIKPEIPKAKAEVPKVKAEVQKKIEIPETQSVSVKIQKTEKTVSDKFLQKIKSYFKANDIEIIEEKLIRKNSEIDFVVKVPSAVGHLVYFCKAKSKSKVTDGDLSSLFFQGQSKKLPILFLTQGELTKKAEVMLNSEFKGMSVKRI